MAKEFKFHNPRTRRELFLSEIRVELELIPVEPQQNKPYSVALVIQGPRMMVQPLNLIRRDGR